MGRGRTKGGVFGREKGGEGGFDVGEGGEEHEAGDCIHDERRREMKPNESAKLFPKTQFSSYNPEIKRTDPMCLNE